MPTIAPYGSWRSPITSELIVGTNIRLGQPRLDGDAIYWIEGRPLEGGRNVIVQRSADGQIRDITPTGFNVRTTVHEYGGAAYQVADQTIYFANFADQRLYRQPVDGQPQALTADEALRYADFVLDRGRNRLISVCEDHRQPGEAENYIATIDLVSGSVTPLSRGRNFYAAPRLSPDGNQLAWLAWDHPYMPWDAAELWVATLDADGVFSSAAQVAGGLGDSAVQPEWAADGSLFAILERTGWWNLYHLRAGVVTPLAPAEAEFAHPQWQFASDSYAVLSPERVLCSYVQDGHWSLAILDLAAGTQTPFELPYSDIWEIRATGNQAIFMAGSPSQPSSLIALDLATFTATEIRRSASVSVEAGYLSIPEAITFPTEGGLMAHGFFYPPANQEYSAPQGELPPLLVKSHGGPTGATEAILDLKIQYWTSRGFAVLDVNYGGSTGYGREYRERLQRSWGIVDVDDCANGARALVRQGRVDPERLAITGGSAGGYTTLAALAFRDVFKAGASHYGIGDLEAMTVDTHKFESRYLDGLIGVYPAERDVYLARSPIHHVSRLECPTIFFQGLEDKVVPPNQAEMMVAALRAKGIPVAYVPFEGEQHGFRKAANIRRAIDGEFYFYSRVFGFTPESIDPIDIT